MRYSIITITKNNPDGFQRTKDSVASQTCTDYEWVVVDGDKEPDNGIYDAMNKGIYRAQGDYVIFMNAGDIFADEKTLERLSHINADFIYGDAIEDEHTKKAKHHTAVHRGMITHHQAMVYSTTLLKTLRYDERYFIAADYKLTLEFIHLSNCIYYINTPLCIFELGGVSQHNARQARDEEIAIRKEMNICAPFTPYRQWAAQMMKHHYPRLYLMARSLIDDFR